MTAQPPRDVSAGLKLAQSIIRKNIKIHTNNRCCDICCCQALRHSLEQIVDELTRLTRKDDDDKRAG